MESLKEYINGKLDGICVLVYLIDGKSGYLRPFYCHGIDEQIFNNYMFREGDANVLNYLLDRGTVFIEDVHKDKSLGNAAEGFRVKSLFGSKVRLCDGIDGFIIFLSNSGRVISKEETGLLEFIVQNMKLEMSNFILKEKVKQYSAWDDALGVYKFENFYRLFEEELSRAERYNNFFSLLFFEVNGVKRSDAVRAMKQGLLKELITIVRKNIETTDIVGIAEDEVITVGLKDMMGEEGMEVAEKIKKDFDVRTACKPESAFTVSIGLASFPKDSMMPEELWSNAASALLSSKEKGNPIRYRKSRILPETGFSK